MRPSRPTLRELRELGSLAVPFVVIQLAMMALGVEDTMIVGRYSAAALAGVAIGSLYTFALGSFGLGLVMGIEPLVSQAVGANDTEAVARAFQRGLVIVAVMGTLSCFAFLPARAVLHALGQPRVIADIASPYLLVQAPSMYAFLLFSLLRIKLQARSITRPILTAICVANLVNVVLGISLVFGEFGLPRMGPLGSGVATLIARYVMALTLLLAAWPQLRPALAWRADTLATAPMLRVLAIGLPVAIQLTLEFGVFAIVGVVMGSLGPVPMAAHQIALNIASLTYMVPLGVSMAGSVLVGRAIGAGRPGEARRVALAALVTGVGFMGLSALAFTFVPRVFAGAYTNDPSTIALAATLIPIAGVFQVFDGTQVVSIGLLRGTGDTRTPMLVNLVGYWGVALPLGLWLGRGRHMGPVGLWWGLVAGLVVVALIVLVRLRVRLGRTLVRLHVEDGRVTGSAD